MEIITLNTTHEQNSNASHESNPHSSQRIRYESEVDMIIKKWGSLDQMREKLGVTRRKMCEILLVDPSAWTRWTGSNNGVDTAPAHVYKTMSLILQNSENQRENILVKNSENPRALEQELKNVKTEIDSLIAKSKGVIHSDIEEKVRTILESYAVDLESRVNSHNETHNAKLDSFIRSKTELSLGWKILILLNLVAIIYFIVS